MKAYWESGGIAPHILDVGIRWRWVVSFTLRPLYPQRKSPWYPLGRRLGGPKCRSGRGGEEKNSQPLAGFEPPIIQTVAQRYTIELSQLLTNSPVAEPEDSAPLILKPAIWLGAMNARTFCRVEERSAVARGEGGVAMALGHAVAVSILGQSQRSGLVFIHAATTRSAQVSHLGRRVRHLGWHRNMSHAAGHHIVPPDRQVVRTGH
jgi:hypothetical protein